MTGDREAKSVSEPIIDLWIGTNQVASVQFNAGRVISFTYTDQWTKEGFELSPALDFSGKVPASAASAYLENLFPEGDVFESFVESLGVSKSNHYALIRAMGKETSGSLMLLPEGEKPEKINPGIRIIQGEEFARRVAKSDDFPIAVWDGRIRLSVAGLQSKMNVIYAGNGNLIGLPEGSSSSTHILKFEKRNQNHLVLNEKLMLDAARRLGIPVCNAEILTVQDKRLLLVERFDRKVDVAKKVPAQARKPNPDVRPEEELRALEIHYSLSTIDIPAVQRLHFIDGCQALGLKPSLKYERNLGDEKDVRDIREGVSFYDLGEISKLCIDAAKDRESILKWSIFNLAVGNYDAHGKNISFSVSDRGLQLAPFYDLVSIESLGSKFKNTFSMAYGENFGEAPFSWGDLMHFAKDICVSEKDLFEQTTEVLRNLPSAIELSISGLTDLRQDEIEFAKFLVETCTRRSEELLKMLPQKSLKAGAKRKPPISQPK